MKITNSKTATNLSGEGILLSDQDFKLLKNKEFEILCDIKSVCEKHQIKYYLAYGTLLGAVRHQGFIPWDDDIDICIKLEDILTLIPLLDLYYPNKYDVIGYMHNNILDPFFGYKIMLKGTEYREVECQSFPFKRGINIDIFPIVSVPKTKFGRKIKYIKTRLLNVICTLRNEFNYPPHNLINSINKDVKRFYAKRRFLTLPLLIFSNKIWQSLRKKELFKKYKGSDNYAFIYTGLKSKVVTKNELENMQYVTFENSLFTTFNNPESFLTYWYGNDWNQLPEESKREKHPIFSFKILKP